MASLAWQLQREDESERSVDPIHCFGGEPAGPWPEQGDRQRNGLVALDEPIAWEATLPSCDGDQVGWLELG
jgi:hypothetical protein